MYEQGQSFKFNIGVHDMLIRNSQHKQFSAYIYYHKYTNFKHGTIMYTN